MRKSANPGLQRSASPPVKRNDVHASQLSVEDFNVSFQDEDGVVRWRLHLTSPPEKVFAALATAEGRASFWAEEASEASGYITFRFLGHPPTRGRVLRSEAPTHFVLEYFGARTEFTLRPDGRAGTELELLVRGVQESERCETIAGWVSVLMAMKAAVDHGVDLRNHHVGYTWQRGYADN